MGQISLTLPSDGTTIEAADVNNPLNALLNEFNGNIDDNNIKSGANISGTKLGANTLPPTVYDANARAGWLTGILPAPNTVTALGNRSYQLVFNSTDLTGYISPGDRLRSTRTTAAPNQCASLNGSNNYFSKASPSGMTFTDDFVASAWIKLTSYPSVDATIASRYNGTSGWIFEINPSGQLKLIGINGGAGNNSQILSYQSVPLNKWVHVAAQLDMSAFTATTTTSYTMIDGVDVPAAVSRGGTNPTALVQAGNLEIGAFNSGAASTFFPGKIAQVAIFSAKVTQATIQTYLSQGLAGTETSLISAYTFSNSINDLNTTNANNLTNNNSTSITAADSPFGGQADGTISTTLDYAIVTKTAFSTNTTLTVQVPEGCTLPTSGGISALAYSGIKAPYNFPAQRGKWEVATYMNVRNSVGAGTAGTWYYSNFSLNIPLGEWEVSYQAYAIATWAAGTTFAAPQLTLSTSSSSLSDTEFWAGGVLGSTAQSEVDATLSRNKFLSLSAATPYYLLITSSGGNPNGQFVGNNNSSTTSSFRISAVCAHL